MKVLVCGGRDFDDMDLVERTLDAIDVTEIIEGGAQGADRLAREWAEFRRVPVRTFKADWKRYGRGAGPQRNQQMLDEGQPDLVVAFPRRKGDREHDAPCPRRQRPRWGGPLKRACKLTGNPDGRVVVEMTYRDAINEAIDEMKPKGLRPGLLAFVADDGRVELYGWNVDPACFLRHLADTYRDVHSSFEEGH